MTDFMVPLEAEEIQEAPPVATIWPTTVKFTEDEKSAGELAVKYSHLRQLDIDDKPAYKELVAAIADARNKRLDISKQEDVIKDPINKYRNLLIDTSKKIRGLFGDVESDLKKEKKRIDDIREERKLAMERLWQENLNSVRSMTEGLPSMGIISLNMLLDDLNNFDFESLDFGDYIEQAKATVDNQINAVNERIEFLKEKQRLEEEQHALRIKQAEEAAERKRLDDERIEREASEQKKRDDEKAEADRKQAETDTENQRLRDQIAAMQKEAEPEPEPEIIGVDMASEPDTSVMIEVTTDETGHHVAVVPVAGRAAAIEQEPESTVVREEPKQVEDEHHGNIDPISLAVWEKEIRDAMHKAPIVLTPKAKNAAKAVSDQLDQICSYLIKTAESLR